MSNITSDATPEVSQDGLSGDFISNILTPGSSLNPLFLTIVDGVLATLLLIFLGLLFLTRGSIHFIFLMAITGCLWASVKWFVAELQSVRAQEPTQSHPGPSVEKSNSKLKEE
ncbi:ER protein Pkr1-domain-containing protein [Cerioporus squamosus]|nr:ER protein Pkr1-domain-containing protein [Cerioporus squamosus]